MGTYDRLFIQHGEALEALANEMEVCASTSGRPLRLLFHIPSFDKVDPSALFWCEAHSHFMLFLTLQQREKKAAGAHISEAAQERLAHMQFLRAYILHDRWAPFENFTAQLQIITLSSNSPFLRLSCILPSLLNGQPVENG